jgi:hypothetical protein
VKRFYGLFLELAGVLDLRSLLADGVESYPGQSEVHLPVVVRDDWIADLVPVCAFALVEVELPHAALVVAAVEKAEKVAFHLRNRPKKTHIR